MYSCHYFQFLPTDFSEILANRNNNRFSFSLNFPLDQTLKKATLRTQVEKAYCAKASISGMRDQDFLCLLVLVRHAALEGVVLW